VFDPDDVVESSTTLFTNSLSGNLTYMIRMDGGACYAMGDDPTYYSAEQCTVL
jgi:hypothetical protein